MIYKLMIIAALLIFIAALIGIYVDYLKDQQSGEDKKEIIKNDDKNTEKILDVLNENDADTKKRLNALEKAVQNFGKESFNFKKETGFTLDQLKEFSKRIIKESKSHLDKGNAFFILNQYEKAIEEYSEAIIENPYSSLAFFNRANATFHKLLSIKSSSDINNTFYLFNEDFDTKELNDETFKEIILDYKKAFEIDSSLSNVHNNIGVIYNLLGKSEMAISSFEKAISMNNNDSEYYSNLGAVYSDFALSSGNSNYYKKALKNFKTAIKIKDSFSLYPYNIGIVYTRTKEHTKSIKYFNKAIELNPTFYKPYVARGRSYFYLGNYKETINDFGSISDFDRILDIDRYRGELLLLRGSSFFEVKKYPEAIDDLTKCIEFGYGGVAPYEIRGNVFLHLTKYKEAIEDYTKVISREKNNTYVYRTRGVCFAKLGEFEKSIEDFNEAIKINGTVSESYSNRGLSYYHLKNYEKAVIDFRKALSLNPNDKLASHYMKILTNKPQGI